MLDELELIKQANLARAARKAKRVLSTEVHYPEGAVRRLLSTNLTPGTKALPLKERLRMGVKNLGREAKSSALEAVGKKPGYWS
jgi:hypothetical protein